MTRVLMRELPALVGRLLGPSEPVLVDQARIDAFAECTIDPQWIHVDPERAAAGPFGTTIAHGFLTLSLLSHVFDELLQVEDAAMGVNYGLDRVRFPAPLPSGSLVRATLEPLTVEPATGHTRMTARVTFSAEGANRPCCVADSVTRFVEHAA